MQKFRGDDKEIKFKPALTQHRRYGSHEEAGDIVKGKLVEEEVVKPTFEGEDAMDTLLAGVTEESIEQGREKIANERPDIASQNMHEFLNQAAEEMTPEDGAQFYDAKRAASIKHAGIVMDAETGDSVNFKRIRGTGQVEITDDQGGVIDTLASSEFDELLGSGTYKVL